MHTKPFHIIAHILMGIVLLLPLAQAQAQDTLATASPWDASFTVATRNVWRGIDFGHGTPSAQGLLTYQPAPWFDANVLGITSLTGENKGYASTLNLFVNFTFKGLTLTLDNYYFHGDDTNLPTEVWDWANTHFLEGRLAYTLGRFDFTAGYTLAGGGFYHNPVIDSVGTTLRNTRGLYLEATCHFSEALSLTLGGITGPSALNFTDKAGLTQIGLRYTKPLPINDRFSIPMEVLLVANPSFRHIAPFGLPRIGYGGQAVNFVVAFTL